MMTRPTRRPTTRRLAALTLVVVSLSSASLALANRSGADRFGADELAPRSATEVQTLGIGKLAEAPRYRVRYHAAIYSRPEDTVVTAEKRGLTVSAQRSFDRAMGLAEVAISRCYDAMLARSPRSEGTVILGVSFDSAGRVSDVRVAESTFLEQGFEGCLKSAVREVAAPGVPAGREILQPWHFAKAR